MTYRLQEYANWENYLANGRKKYERTLYDRGLRIKHANKFKRGGDIEIVIPWLNNYPIITIHPDDTMTIQSEDATNIWGGTYNPMRSYSTRYTLWKYAGIEVVQRNFQYRLFEFDGPLKPPKIQGCRMCKQVGMIDGYCHPSTCWNGQVDKKGVYVCLDHPVTDNLPNHKRWHYLECSHGELQGHTIPKGQECYSCNGVGKRDYGSQRVSLLWDGSPIRVKDRKIYKQPLTDLERIVASYAGPTTTV
jgi:hypothetical protein